LAVQRELTPRACSKTSVGIELLKKVKHRLIQKRFHARVEHVNPSRSREDFLSRVKANELLKKEAKAKKAPYTTKRQPKGPKGAHVVAISAANLPETMTPKAFDYLI
jgi:large subunit ribosomal protein L21e